MTPAAVARAGRRCGESDASAGREPRDVSRVLLAQLKTDTLRQFWLLAYEEGYRDVRAMQDRKSS